MPHRDRKSRNDSSDIFMKNHRRHRSRSSSSSSSSCSSSSSSSSSSSCYKKPECKRRSSSCSSRSSSDKDCIPFEVLYDWMKCKLVRDDELMVAGSTAYTTAVNTTTAFIPQYFPSEISTNLLQYNVEHIQPGLPFVVREDGIYALFFVALDDESSQFTVFVNGTIRELTTVGTNSGAGQLVSRHLIDLRKDDCILIRNYISSSAAVTANQFAGGLLPGNDLTFKLFKVAPLNVACVDYKNKHEFECKLSHKKKKLFCKLLEYMESDNQLMIKGFNVRGSFFNMNTQIVPTESDVVFNAFDNVSGLVWNPTGANPEQIKVLEDGIYSLTSLLTTNTTAQFTYTINGIPDETTTQGTNRGAGQLTNRTLLELQAGDIITLRNHTSANGNVIISEQAGGKYNSISAILVVFKIAPLSKVECCPKLEHKYEHKYNCLYELFKTWLLYQHNLQLTGSPAFLSTTTSAHQVIQANDSVYFFNNVINRHLKHIQGTEDIKIEKNGVYYVFADIICNEPTQFTLFINGVPNMNTVFGIDSGSVRNMLRQLVKLDRGDVVSIRNYESHAATLNSAVNPGGNYIGQSLQFMLFYLSDDCSYVPLCPPRPPCPPCPPCSEPKVNDEKPSREKPSRENNERTVVQREHRSRRSKK